MDSSPSVSSAVCLGSSSPSKNLQCLGFSFSSYGAANLDFSTAALDFTSLGLAPSAKSAIRLGFPSSSGAVSRYTEIDDLVRTGRPHTLILSSLSMLIRPLRHRDDGEGKSLALWTQMDNCITQLQAISCNLDLIVQLPLPASYTVHTSRFIRLWIGTLPFVLLGFIRPVLVPIIVLLIAWALYSTEELAQIMEEPFGDEIAGKPETIKLDVFCRRIIFALKQQVWVQETLDSRVNARSWVITPEDLPKVRQLEKEEAFNKKNAWDVD